MDKIILVNGYPESGKDTFVDFCLEILGPYGAKVSTIDFVKYLAAQCGWDGTKTLENRKFLSNLKDLLTKWADVPYHKTMCEIENHFFGLEQFNLRDMGVVFVMCREPEEIQKFVERTGAKTLCVRREEAEKQKTSNHADAKVLEYKYDYYINNNYSLEHLKIAAKAFVDLIRKK